MILEEITEIWEVITMVRCKFKITHIAQTSNMPEAKQITMFPCNGEPFGQYTPAGQLTMTVVNPGAASQLILGQEYYVDLTPIGGEGDGPE